LLVVAVIAVTVGLGWWIGTEIAHKRAADRNRGAAERVRAAAERERASDAAEARKERQEQQEEQRLGTLDDAIDTANRELFHAAKAGRRTDVARAETALTRASQRRNAAHKPPAHRPKDPYVRELDSFPVKEPPLFAQQMTWSEDDHVLFLSVSRAYLCLKDPADRLRRVRETYAPVERRLRRAGIKDFEIVVTPVTPQAPTRSGALAKGAAGTVTLTNLGRAC